MVYLVLWSACSFDWDGTLGVLVGGLGVLVGVFLLGWRIWCLWHWNDVFVTQHGAFDGKKHASCGENISYGDTVQYGRTNSINSLLLAEFNV